MRCSKTWPSERSKLSKSRSKETRKVRRCSLRSYTDPKKPCLPKMSMLSWRKGCSTLTAKKTHIQPSLTWSIKKLSETATRRNRGRTSACGRLMYNTKLCWTPTRVARMSRSSSSGSIQCARWPWRRNWRTNSLRNMTRTQYKSRSTSGARALKP